MSGLENIIEKIETDCTAKCGEILQAAGLKALDITGEARALGERLRSERSEEARRHARNERTRASARAEHEQKAGILAAKNEYIQEIIDKAMQRMERMPDHDYFRALEILVRRFARYGHGTVQLSERDLMRVPEGFEAALNDALAGTGRTVSISREPAGIRSGLVIAYEGIEQNCSFDSLLSESADEIKDMLNALLFSGDSL